MKIIEHWNKLSTKGEYIHPDDAIHRQTLNKWKFNTNLVPIPYAGDLRNAKIIIAMLNPGLQPEDPVWEEENRYNFKGVLLSNLRQDTSLQNQEYPFFYLNPAFEEHPGYKYWHKRFKKIIDSLANSEAQKMVARNLAILQLVPYHSEKYKGSLHERLTSSKEAMKAFEMLVKDKNRLIIVPRKHRSWLSEPCPSKPIKKDNIIRFYRRNAYFPDEVHSWIIEYLANSK